MICDSTGNIGYTNGFSINPKKKFEDYVICNI